MRLLLVRHGESKANVDPEVYTVEGDGLTDRGWRQGVGSGNFLGEIYKGQSEWPILYLSPYQRTQETLAAILHGMGDIIPGTQPVLRGDSRLIEKSFGAINILNNPPESVNREFAEQFRVVSNLVYGVDPFTTPNPLGESSKDNLVSVKGFIDGTLNRQFLAGGDDFLFVIHGAVIRNFILSWAHLPPQSRQDILSPGNGDVIAIEGEMENWRIHKIYDGEKGQKVNIDLLAELSPMTIDDLPEVPDRIKENPELDAPDPP